MANKTKAAETEIRIAADLDPVGAADCCTGLLTILGALPTGSPVALTVGSARVTAPSLQLFFAALRFLQTGGHPIRLGAEGAAVLAASNLSSALGA